MLQAFDIDAVERKVTRLLDSLVTGCWIRGFRGEPGFWSDQVFDLYGLPVSEKPPSAEILFRQLDAGSEARMWQAVERCRKGEASFFLEYTVRTPQGVTRRLKSSGQIARAASDEMTLIGTVQDVSAVEPLRTEVQALTKTLKKARRSCEIDGLSPHRWARIEALIRERQGKDLSIRELAGFLALKSAEFSRRFKITTGETPHQYLLRYRLDRASEALRSPGASIAQVAANGGFFDQAHFTRQFKRRYGVTPARFAHALA